MNYKIFSLLLLAVTFLGYNVSAQSTYQLKDFKTTAQNDNYTKNKFAIVKGDSLIHEYEYDPMQIKKVIVIFSKPPLSRVYPQKNQNQFQKERRVEVQSAYYEIQAEHSLFRSDLSVIEQKLKSEIQTQASQISVEYLFEYETAINGFAIKTNNHIVNEIKKLPYVIGVYDDQEFKIDFEEQKATGEIIKSLDKIDSEYTGKGVVIGIIDTGIDYTHPDLGGGFGSNYKVIGGYDFFNNDNNPMDDNGHGTFVAGIAAANGNTFNGLAKDAKLLAYKVLGSTGWGSSSLVIAAIEKCLNPDGNNLTDDAVNVINLSLGNVMGDPKDPSSQAVDNACQYGVVCVVAAGNDGGSLGYNSIASPASSIQAISVGAADGASDIAYFSAKGPTRFDYAIKPELLAPGVNIYSTKVGGGYNTASGTSSAAPYIAGVTALLKEKNPNWNHQEIKSLLTQSTIDLGKDVWSQGFGLIDKDKSLLQDVLIIPATFNMGIVNTSDVINKKIKIHNYSNSNAHYTLSLESTQSLNAIFDPSTVDVKAQDSAEISVNISVNSSMGYIDVNKEDWLPYYGEIKAVSTNDTLRVLFSFLRSHFLTINIDNYENISTFFYIHNKGNFIYLKDGPQIRNDYSDGKTILLNEGIYDAIGFQTETNIDNWTITRYLVTQENIDITKTRTVDLRKSLAKYKRTLVARDDNGAVISFNRQSSIANFVHTLSGYGFFYDTEGFKEFDELHYNKISSDYRYDWYTTSRVYEEPVYHFKVSLTDVSRDISEELNLKNFARVKLYYKTPQNVENIWMREWNGGTVVLSADWDLKKAVFNTPFVNNAYLMEDPYERFPYSAIAGVYTDVFFFSSSQTTDPNMATHLYTTPWYKVLNGKIESFLYVDKDNNQLTIRGNKITYGLGPVHWFAVFENNANYLKLRSNTGVGFAFNSYINQQEKIFFPFVLNQLQDFSPQPDLSFTIYDGNGNIVKSGKFGDFFISGIKNNLYDYYSQISLPSSGKYTLQVVDSSYTIQNHKGKMTVTAVANTQEVDKNPPSMKSFNILTNGEFTDLVSIEQPSGIQFFVEDKESSVTASLFYREFNQSVWEEINVLYQEGLYYAEINSQFPRGYVSLKLNVKDSGGNELEYIAEPAFYNSDQNLKPLQATLSEPLNESKSNSTSLKLKWLTSEGADRYHLQLSEDSLFTNIVINDSLLTINEKYATNLKNDTKYFWRVNAINMYGKGVWSTVWKFRTKLALPNKIALINPEDKFVLTTDSLQFKWRRSSPQVSKYWFVISTDSLYKNTVVDTTLTDTTKVYKNFVSVYSYWWKVKAKNESGWGQFSDPRKIFLSFKPSQTTLLEPINGSKGKQISLKLKWLPLEGALRYHFQLSYDSLFTNVAVNDSLLTTTEKSVNYLKNDTEYFWRVSVINMYGEGKWSEAWKFRTKLMLPNKIALVFPEDKYVLTTDSLQFEWRKSSPQISKYWFAISTDSLLKNAVIDTMLTDTVKVYKNFVAGYNHWWVVKAKNESGWGTYSDSRKIFFNPVDVEEMEELPTVYSLSQNYPNPFNPTTTIEYTIPNIETLHATSQQHVTLKIYNILGREVTTLVNEHKQPGRYKVEFGTHGSELPSGIYFYRLTVSSSASSAQVYSAVRKMILLK